jgi:hypothetical protein
LDLNDSFLLTLAIDKSEKISKNFKSSFAFVLNFIKKQKKLTFSLDLAYSKAKEAIVKSKFYDTLKRLKNNHEFNLTKKQTTNNNPCCLSCTRTNFDHCHGNECRTWFSCRNKNNSNSNSKNKNNSILNYRKNSSFVSNKSSKFNKINYLHLLLLLLMVPFCIFALAYLHFYSMPDPGLKMIEYYYIQLENPWFGYLLI